MIDEVATLIKKRSQKAGLPAGSLIYVGDRKSDKTTIKIIMYNQEAFKEVNFEEFGDYIPIRKDSVTWMNVNGVHEKGIIEKIGKMF